MEYVIDETRFALMGIGSAPLSQTLGLMQHSEADFKMVLKGINKLTMAQAAQLILQLLSMTIIAIERRVDGLTDVVVTSCI